MSNFDSNNAGILILTPEFVLQRHISMVIIILDGFIDKSLGIHQHRKFSFQHFFTFIFIWGSIKVDS